MTEKPLSGPFEYLLREYLNGGLQGGLKGVSAGQSPALSWTDVVLTHESPTSGAHPLLWGFCVIAQLYCETTIIDMMLQVTTKGLIYATKYRRL